METADKAQGDSCNRQDKINLNETAFKLTNAFRQNFKQFEEFASEEIRRGGPQRYGF